MPSVHLIGHRAVYPVMDILRLFFGPARQAEPDRIVCGQPEPELTSTLTRFPHAAATEPDVRIVTTLPGYGALEASVQLTQAGREIKRQLYQVLSGWTGMVFPWGSLTGIRPTLIALECQRRTRNLAAAQLELTQFYGVSAEKADLALATGLAEAQLLADLAPGPAVYLGIPFCPGRCSYCSFITEDAPRQLALMDPYVAALQHELTGVSAWLTAQPCAVYIGGGTPTSLSTAQLARLLKTLRTSLQLSDATELTLEAGRPDTIDADKLAVLRACGINRLCINPQTFHDTTLRRIGRGHSADCTRHAVVLARSFGFAHINMDLIAGLPGETPEDFQASLTETLRLSPDSITLHALAHKRSARLPRSADAVPETLHRPEPAWNEQLAIARQMLRQEGYAPYYLYRQKDTVGGLENTGYARPGKACAYNVAMMSDRWPVIGLGSGAMSKRTGDARIERLPSPRDVSVYLARLDSLITAKQRFFTAEA